MNNYNARQAHETIDKLVAGDFDSTTPGEIEALRQYLPDKPEQKTLAEIASSLERIVVFDLEDLDSEVEASIREELAQIRSRAVELGEQPFPRKFTKVSEDVYRVPVDPKLWKRLRENTEQKGKAE